MIRDNSKERLEKLIRWTGLNTYALANELGFSSARTLYQIKAGKYQISRQVAQRICGRYPEISLGWLLSGEGEMLPRQHYPVPYYSADCREVVGSNAPPSPMGHITMVGCGCGGASFVAPYNAQDMEPDIHAGNLLFCNKCDYGEVCAGGIYLLATRRKAMVCRVVEVGDGWLSLTTTKHPHNLPEVVERTLIKQSFKVVAAMEWRCFCGAQKHDNKDNL